MSSLAVSATGGPLVQRIQKFALENRYTPPPEQTPGTFLGVEVVRPCGADGHPSSRPDSCLLGRIRPCLEGSDSPNYFNSTAHLQRLRALPMAGHCGVSDPCEFLRLDTLALYSPLAGVRRAGLIAAQHYK